MITPSDAEVRASVDHESRTAAMSRTEAAARFGQLHDTNATPITADQLECRASVGSRCIWVPADAAEVRGHAEYIAE